MPRFRATNIVVNFDETVVTVEDPITKQRVYTANPNLAAQQWEADVMFTLESLYISSRVSRMLFDATQAAGGKDKAGNYSRYMVIRPYDPPPTDPNKCNAYAGPNDYDMSATTKRIDGNPGGTKGVGSTTTIRWDKARWVNNTKCGGLAGQPGGTFHDVLLHEMLHGLRQMAGQQDRSPLPNGWTSMEEFYAILITNVSMSERGHKQFRKNHTGFGVLEPEFSSSAGFLMNPQHLKWVDWLYNTNAVMFKQVGQVNARFNPIEEYAANLPAWKVVLANPPTTR
jgi:hypothetical protein